MQEYFYDLATALEKKLHADEVCLCNFSGEESDFIRFNQSKIRQAGYVTQRYFNLELIQGQRHVAINLSLNGDYPADLALLHSQLKKLRQVLPDVAEDPYLLYAKENCSSAQQAPNELPPAGENAQNILTLAGQSAQNHGNALDLVGIYASGGIYRGFANSLGQRNWHSSYSFNFDWSCYHREDKAVKAQYAGGRWDKQTFEAKLQHIQEQLSVLRKPSRTVNPGMYRVYLAPAALSEIIQMMNWGGFSLKARRSKQSPLLHMLEKPKRKLSPLLNLQENTAQGVGPSFQEQGFIKPPQVSLIIAGECHEALVSPRSAQEYKIPGNGANSNESQEAADLGAGALAMGKSVEALHQGIYINNLWYLNYSDRAAARITGMTRFATFWVENGEITAPINVMRFDDTIYRILGDKLLDLTREREFILDSDTYGRRSTDSKRLPGALVEEFKFTL